MRELVAELQVDLAVCDGGVESRWAVGGGQRVRCPRRRCESGEQDGIVERRTHLADTAADAIGQLAVKDDACDLIARGRRAQAYSIVERENIVRLHEGAIELARCEGDVMSAVARGILCMVACEHAVDGGKCVVRDDGLSLFDRNLGAHGEREGR